MVVQSGFGLSRTETIDYARSVIDVIVQLGREGAQRKIVAIEQISPAGNVSQTVRKLIDRVAA